MSSVSVNAPKTPVTEGSEGFASATLPNVCKMPGPPAPFVPTPLPNIGKSGSDPKNYSQSVTIEGKKVAIRGATFGSMGDVASKGTGGGLVSSNVEGPTSFVGPGSMNVKVEGKNVQLLGDPMLNNCGPGGNPANAATMMGVVQANGHVIAVTGEENCPLCNKNHDAFEETHDKDGTKGAASKLASKLNEVLTQHDSRKAKQKRKHFSTMLGVVQCKCGNKYYADHSDETVSEFHEAVQQLGETWYTSEAILSVGEKINHSSKSKEEKKEIRTNTDADRSANETQVKIRWRLLSYCRSHEMVQTVTDTWMEAQELSTASDKNRQMPAAYPPGACAAQKAIVLARDHGAFPNALTEQFYRSNPIKDTNTGELHKTSAKIAFINAKTGKIDEEPFKHGDSVPPCGTCNLILPLMICPGNQEAKCNHMKD